MKIAIPKLLFKFKSLSSIEDLERLIDILKNNRIYIPKRDQLNDPLEGFAIETCTATVGSSIAAANDIVDAAVRGILDSYRILALTSDVFSPQMWAHYSNTYTGVCIGYYTKGAFSRASQVEYITEKPESVSEIDGICIDDRYFLQKDFGWAYEKEWRIIEQDQTGDNCYFEYTSDDLACIVFGNKIRKETEEIIQAYIPQTIPQYMALPGERSFRIQLLSADYERTWDGTQPPFITNEHELLRHIKSVD